jgi:2-keto-4-pentenoate hydratase/2-oxohepta-3-ene-1,7-dioic acid hydratase in catechol pathway
MRIARFSAGGDVGFAALEGDELAVLDRHPFGQVSFTGVRLPLADVRLLAPMIPSKIVAIGKNYAEHAREMGGDASPDTPVIFIKPSTSVCGPGDPVQYPAGVQRLDFEGELAVVIGRLARDVPADKALDVVLGYTCANDVTARDQQKADGQWTRAKGYDSFCPLGPWIETDLDPSDLAVTTKLNGDVRQSARTSDLIHRVADCIAFVSGVMTLLPGDVILTGTPAGVGPMTAGDEVSVTIEGIGTLTNTVTTRG